MAVAEYHISTYCIRMLDLEVNIRGTASTEEKADVVKDDQCDDLADPIDLQMIPTSQFVFQNRADKRCNDDDYAVLWWVALLKEVDVVLQRSTLICRTARAFGARWCGRRGRLRCALRPPPPPPPPPPPLPPRRPPPPTPSSDPHTIVRIIRNFGLEVCRLARFYSIPMLGARGSSPAAVAPEPDSRAERSGAGHGKGRSMAARLVAGRRGTESSTKRGWGRGKVERGGVWGEASVAQSVRCAPFARTCDRQADERAARLARRAPARPPAAPPAPPPCPTPPHRSRLLLPAPPLLNALSTATSLVRSLPPPCAPSPRRSTLSAASHPRPAPLAPSPTAPPRPPPRRPAFPARLHAAPPASPPDSLSTDPLILPASRPAPPAPAPPPPAPRSSTPPRPPRRSGAPPGPSQLVFAGSRNVTVLHLRCTFCFAGLHLPNCPLQRVHQCGNVSRSLQPHGREKNRLIKRDRDIRAECTNGARARREHTATSPTR
ncbi:Protein of unknown function [Gryllus bimaculatus]|nr:Protein of unknown function [Gryllus bimaculatus]